MSLTTKIVVMFGVAFSLLVSSGARSSKRDEECAVVHEALQKVHELKAGDSRAKLEVSFELDGGLQIASNSRYALKKCRYIKLDVEFSDKNGSSQVEFLPTDKISKMSQLYVEYPVAD